MKWSAILTPVPCAMLFCMANALKPAVIDDVVYLWLAKQIAQTPAEPFGPPPDGFRLIWYDYGQPAFTLLAPPVVPYWMALGIVLFGENLVIVKLWLFPFCLLFTLSLHSLLKRFAPRMEKPLLALSVLSPTFLPSLNVMVDVPAIALNLTAIAIFCRALDGPMPRWKMVILAGFVAGLAAQTKYTGATAFAVLLLYGLIRRRKLAAIAAVAIAATFFVGWEAYLSHVYGRSHFLLQLEKQRMKAPADESKSAIERSAIEFVQTLENKAGMTIPLIGYLGGLGLPLVPLLMLALRFRMRTVHYFSGILLAGFLLVMLLPTRWSELYHDERNPHVVVSVGTVFMGMAGIWLGLLLGACCAVLMFKRTIRIRRSGTCWFLLGWLAIEVFAFYLLSPFTATRRVMGIVAAATMVMGRVLIVPQDGKRRKWILRYTVVGAAIGLIYAWTDYRDAVAERDALVASVNLVHEQSEASPRIWFTGHWGFQYYGEQQGLRTIYPRESIIDEGDWIIMPDIPPRPYSQPLRLEMPFAEKRGLIEIHDPWPLSTNPIYYDGFMPIQRHDGYRLRIAVYRANQRFLAWPN